MTMFAQISDVPGEQVKNVLLVLGWLLGLGMLVYGKWNKQKVQVADQPVDVSVAGPVTVQKEERYVPKALCVQLHASTDQRITKVERDLGDLTTEFRAQRAQAEASARARSAGLYDKIDQVRLELAGQVSGLRAQFDTMRMDTERALGRIEGKLDKLD
jgi:hypothetical protein